MGEGGEETGGRFSGIHDGWAEGDPLVGGWRVGGGV